VGVSVWLLELGPVPQLHLTAPLMLIHVSLDAYAFVGTHMFETNPATQRMAEQTGLDSLSDPVFILDTEQQIVRVNDRAEALFSSTLSNTLPISLNTVLGVELETLREDGEIRLEMERDRTFAVSYTGLSDPSGTSVGSMLLLYDVTEDRQREQQLAVLNRVLRHNLRNETTVIGGYADLLENALSDPERAAQAGKIEDASDRLLAIAEKSTHVRGDSKTRQTTSGPRCLYRLTRGYTERFPCSQRRHYWSGLLLHQSFSFEQIRYCSRWFSRISSRTRLFTQGVRANSEHQRLQSI